MRKFGLRVQKGELALTAEESKKVSAKLDPTGGLILKS